MTQIVAKPSSSLDERWNAIDSVVLCVTDKDDIDPLSPADNTERDSFLTFPELLTSTGKEQKRNTPSARSSSGQLFTLNALGSSKASVAERRSVGLSAVVLETTVPTNLTGASWADSRRTREQIILVLELFWFSECQSYRSQRRGKKKSYSQNSFPRCLSCVNIRTCWT